MFLYVLFAYQYINYWIYITYLFFYSLIFDIQIKQLEDSSEKILYDRELKRFRKYEENIEPCEKNRNIEAFYYDKHQYKEVFKDPKNEHEVNWKRKILYMTTPVGNIAMFYDPFKLGFSYYADQSYVKYDILNAIAMKYVIIFRCWDFFMDELVLKSSPLIKIHILEDTKIDITKPNYNAIKAQKMENSPFAKFKKSESILPPILKNKITTSIKTPKEKEFNYNKFLYLGKIQNMNFIQPISKNKIRRLPAFQSALLDGVEKNAVLQGECLSYKDYIKMKKEMKKE